MELKAIILFTEFPYVNVLYRAFDGEYFVEFDDVQAYLVGVGGGAYTVINRVTPLPPLPEPLPEDSPIWVLINNPTVISNGLRYDGVISYTNTTVGSLGAVTFTVNKVGAFRVGNYVFAVSRKGASVGMLKYGHITAINSNNLTINFLEFEGTGSLANDEWDIVLTGKKGIEGTKGDKGDKGDEGDAGSPGPKGDDGNKIFTISGVPVSALGEKNDILINSNTFGYYVNNKPVVYNDPIPPNGNSSSDRSIGNWQYVGILKGEKGDNSIEVLTGTGVLNLSNQQVGKTLRVPSDSAITGISLNNLTVAGTTVFLLEKTLENGIERNGDISQFSQAFADEYFMLKNYTEPQSGFWFNKISLKGANGTNFFTDYSFEVNTNNYLVSADKPIILLSTTSGMTTNIIVPSKVFNGTSWVGSDFLPYIKIVLKGAGGIVNVVNQQGATLAKMYPNYSARTVELYKSGSGYVVLKKDREVLAYEFWLDNSSVIVTGANSKYFELPLFPNINFSDIISFSADVFFEGLLKKIGVLDTVPSYYWSGLGTDDFCCYEHSSRRLHFALSQTITTSNKVKFKILYNN